MANDLDLDQFVVCAINNAWQVPSRMDYHIYSCDWQPPGAPYPLLNAQHVRITSLQYDSKEQRKRFGRQEVGIGATMFFNAAYWILGELQPREMYFLGCSMHYPQGAANTFYGSGNPDPLRFGKDTLLRWFDLLKVSACDSGCSLYNLGSRDGLMPY